METDRAKLLASRGSALAAKDAFVSAYGSDLSNCSVGLGVSRDGQEWALKVYVQNAGTETHLPDHFERFEVDVEVIGVVSAQ